VVAGVVDRLGIDGGPRDTMLAADQFNSEGYWEQGSLVEWHDRVLASLGGWASAPPPPPSSRAVAAAFAEHGAASKRLVNTLYGERWFMKDPRQCLLLWLWTAARGHQDLAVVVVREPGGVARSLANRNGYPPALSVALWERYCHDVLVSLEGRRCVVLPYRDLTLDPAHWVEVLADALDQHLAPPGDPYSARVGDAVSLVWRDHGRGDGDAAHTRAGEGLQPEQRALAELLSELHGYHECLTLPGHLPELSAAGTATIERRRRRLNLVRRVPWTADVKAQLDRVPALLRGLRSS
jgi:hypothetical protein